MEPLSAPGMAPSPSPGSQHRCGHGGSRSVGDSRPRCGSRRGPPGRHDRGPRCAPDTRRLPARWRPASPISLAVARRSHGRLPAGWARGSRVQRRPTRALTPPVSTSHGRRRHRSARRIAGRRHLAAGSGASRVACLHGCAAPHLHLPARCIAEVLLCLHSGAHPRRHPAARWRRAVDRHDVAAPPPRRQRPLSPVGVSARCLQPLGAAARAAGRRPAINAPGDRRLH